MLERLKKIQPILAYAAAHLDEDVSLAALGRQVTLSTFHLQRVFAAVAGESPKQFALRLRLQRAAAMLICHEQSILEVALSCGFQSHEVFSRMFRRQFGMSPSAYRKRGLDVSVTQAREHAVLVNKVGPCVRLYHITQEVRSDKTVMNYSIVKKEIAAQPVLLVRRRVKRSDIATTIAEVLPYVFQYAQQNGIALAGLPFTRYVEVGPGLMTIEPGMRIATAAQDPAAIDPAWPQTSGKADVIRDTLPGGFVATTTHVGPYDKLPDAYAAIQQWIETNGLVTAGPPWECYVTDPGDYPDPKDWKTEVFWPVVA